MKNLFKKIKFLLLLLIIFFLTGCNKQQKNLQLKESNLEGQNMIRSPAVAGSFYPANKKDLINQINGFLKKTKPINESGNLKILIVPHAGYDYSGQTATWGYKQLENKKYTRIILVGISHQTYFEKAAVYNKGRWQTPIGETQIDEQFSNTLINQSNNIVANTDVHLNEHSLEVQLPLLQSVLTDFKIVPILLGQSSNEVLTSLAKAISDNLDDNTLIIISSDLSHYPQYNMAEKVDRETINAILSGDINKFSQTIQKNLNQNGVETCACGAEAIKIGLMVANLSGIKNIKLINYSNSGDTGGDKTRVVGYGAIGFYGENLKTPSSAPPSPEWLRRPSKTTENKQNSKLQLKTENLLNKDQQKQLLLIARQTLESYLKDNKIPQIDIIDPLLQEKLGTFVTLRKNGELRGCIGEFKPTKPLYQVVQDKTIDAALHDPRFYPVTLAEFKDLIIEISVLSMPTKIDDWRKIEIGKHGVMIKKGSNGGTFLPQVAQETGWDLETFLNQLCSQKAGLPGDCYKDPNTEIYIYTAQVFEE